MKYLVSILLALCFGASMVSCSREDSFEKKETPSSSELAITELESSSELDSVVSSLVEISTEVVETTIDTTTTTETNSTKETASKATETTTSPSTKGQRVETTVEEIVVKPIETTITTTEYIETTTTLNNEIYLVGIDSYSYQLLAEIVEHEAGMDSISIYDKAHIAAATMNRVYDSRFPNTVYDVLVQPGQYTGYWPGCIAPRSTAYEAVDYYLSHSNEFDNSNSWWGDSYQNYFYYQ